MIALHEDFLLVEGPEGVHLPCSVDHLTLEFIGQAAASVEPEILKQAAAGVLHYFKHEQGRQFITVGEFTEALAKVLDGFGIQAKVMEVQEGQVRTSDLRALAAGAGKLGELEFFQQLRTELRQRMSERPRRIEFLGLRGCVKQLTGRKHWCPACERLQGWIVENLRRWYQLEPEAGGTALVVR
ncbi:MAG: hypothetical protein J0L84_06885 [Verrucomicrobia bacterium]|nr:hypothetical protein [Verrucomicrobiota bacterium]